MKKNIKSVLAKTLAVAMALSLAGVTPNAADAAKKKPVKIAKTTKVTVGKSKKVKITTKKKVKKTTWKLAKKGNQIVKLSKKTKKNVTVTGKKAGTTKLTAKVKIGKKTYSVKTTIKVSKKAVVDDNKETTKPTNAPTPTATPTPNGGGKATPTPNAGGKATPAPVSEFTVNGVKMTVNEADTYSVALTELNETTFSSYSKRPEATSDSDYVALDTFFDKKAGTVTWTSAKEYNSGLSFYINPCTSEEDIVDISETRGEGFKGYKNGTKDMSAYDYVRVKLSSPNEMNLRTYCGNDQLETAGFPGSANAETYEGGWIGPAAGYMESDGGTGQMVKADYVERTVFIPVTDLMDKGTDMSKLTCVALCPQRDGQEVTLSAIDFVKVNYDNKVTGIDVTANKTSLTSGKVANVTASITPENATRKIVKWTSSDESLATVNYKGQVVAGEGKGTVTITATSTDGSNVTGSVDIEINPETADDNKLPAKNVKMALNAEGVVGKTNPGEGESVAATQTATSIEFMTDKNMAIVDFSAYLTANEIDLTNYNAVEVSFDVIGADGNKVTSNEGAGYGKVALVPSAKLNGYDSGVKNAWLNSDAERCGTTAVLDLTAVSSSDVASIAGFNLQLGAVPAGAKIVVTGIKFTVSYDSTVALNAEGVVGKTNPGEGESVAATQTATSIEFMTDKNMAIVDFSAYLTANEIDLTEYSAVEVKFDVIGADGNKVTSNESAGYGKVALVPSAKLNGYDSGVKNAWLNSDAERCGTTAVLDLTAVSASDVASIAGFNLQLGAVPAGAKIVVTGIKFNKSYDVNMALDAVVGKTNPGEGESVAATQTATSIEFMTDKNMAIVDFSAYLTANEIDLTNYNAVEVKFDVIGADGNKVTSNESAGYGKVALVPSAKLNGYDSGVKNAWLNSDAERCGTTAVLDLTAVSSSDVASIAGFNLQLGAVPAGAKIVVTGIKLIYNN